MNIPKHIQSSISKVFNEEPTKSKIRSAAINMYQRLSGKDAPVRSPEYFRETIFNIMNTPSYALLGSEIITDDPLEPDLTEIRAYLATRAPITYAATKRALLDLKSKSNLDTFSLVDVGCGPGTTLWAASDLFPNASFSCFDVDEHMVSVAEKIAKFCNLEAKFTRYFPTSDFDVAVAGFVLGEVSEKVRVKLLPAIYESANYFCFIERGTPDGFKSILKTRDYVLENGGKILAPCSHSLECPLNHTKSWCHFSQRIQMTREMQRTRHSRTDLEDTKFAYLVCQKSNSNVKSHARVLSPPLKRGGHVIMDICAPSGKATRIVASKKDKIAYSHARKSKWGDEWPYVSHIWLSRGPK